MAALDPLENVIKKILVYGHIGPLEKIIKKSPNSPEIIFIKSRLMAIYDL